MPNIKYDVLNKVLDNKVAVITGAVSGIGRATVDLFVAAGANVVAADIQDAKGRELEAAYGSRVRYVHCDVLREEDIHAAIGTAVEHFGGVDCLFNNAGTAGSGELACEVTADGFDAVMHMHLRAALFGIKAVVPVMRQRGGGSIISTASVAGIRTGFGAVLYSSAKAAIIHMTRVSAAQLAAENIRVNCICPGLIATAIVGHSVGLDREAAEAAVDALAEAARNVQPIARGGLAIDIAHAALYLASDMSSFVTGQPLVVDGGLSLGPNQEAQRESFAPLANALGITADQLDSVIGSVGDC